MATQREHPHPGLIKRSVLVMIPGEHRADNVGKSEALRVLKLRCITYPKSAKDDDECHPRVVELLRASGFHVAERLVKIKIDWGLITALVERWRPETHAFHLPFGKVGITSQDVQVLMGLPIDGLPLTEPSSTVGSSYHTHEVPEHQQWPNFSWVEIFGNDHLSGATGGAGPSSQY
ncbi:unnamed protein product [Cuscuta epithymum]|uniref:Aminotransferase-like plant mobile domain-containing protein n=1 Tax=Cuscuta epithymum TaxID=186058 RepID=A0AAV0FSS5_9ASTE|nr:unnamed protein product [Cuscuta epithymum]